MKFKIKNILMLSLSITLYASVTQAQEADEEESENTEIVVTAFKNFCIPQVMQSKLGSQSTFLSNYVNEPGFKFPGDSTSRNVNYFLAAPETMSVNSINEETKKFKIRIGYLACQPKNCPAVLENNSELNLEKNLKESNDIFWHYAIVEEINFEQLYDAHHENVKVSCPLDTCKGVIIESDFGRMFYTVNGHGQDTVRRFIVHGGLGSKMTTEADDEGEISKCETTEASVNSKKKKK